VPVGEFTPNRDKLTSGYSRLPLNSGIELTEKPFRVKPRATEVLSEVPEDGNLIRHIGSDVVIEGEASSDGASRQEKPRMMIKNQIFKFRETARSLAEVVLAAKLCAPQRERSFLNAATQWVRRKGKFKKL
jgi:hypothetical protein